MPDTPSRPHILVLGTGGTITMAPAANGGLGPAADGAALLLPRISELAGVADLSFHSLGDVDSSNIQPAFWVELGQTIYERYREFDGFVVTHGTDTLVYTAAALSFFLQELGKPIVLTGAQIPLTQVGSDGRANLANAVRVASSELAEVCIVFGTRVIRGTRARKTSAFHLEAFESVNDEPIGAIGLTLRLAAHARRRSAARRPLFSPHLLPDVARVPVWPGMSPEVVRYLARTHAGLVIEGFGVGTLPSEERSLLPAIREAIAGGVPVVVGTQCVVGSTALELYQVGRGALEAGAIPAMDMTPEAAQVKLMWALGQSRDLRTIESIMLKSYVGELELACST